MQTGHGERPQVRRDGPGAALRENNVHRLGLHGLHNIAFLLGLAILAALAWQARETQRAVLAANDSVTHRLLRITAVQDLRVSLQDIETGERGFVITGNDRYLQPYLVALGRLPVERQQLEQLARDAAEIRPEWFASLDATIATRIAISAENIATRRERGALAAVERLPLAGGRQTMDRLRDLLDEFESNDRQRLATEKRELEMRVANSQRNAILGGTVVLLLFLVAFFFLDRTLRIRQALTQQAERSSRRLGALLEAVPDTLYEIDAAQVRALGRNVHAETSAELAQALQQRIATAGDRRLLHGFNWQDHTGREYEIRIVPAADDNHLAIVRDITASQRTRRRLHDQQLFLRSVVDADENPIFVRGASGRFVLCNQAFAALLGCHPGQLEGRQPEEVDKSGLIAPLLERDRELLAGAEEVRVPALSLVDASGVQRWFQLLKRPLTLADGSRSVMAVAVDVSERLRVERMKGEFVSTISHELRTPLTAIRGALGIARSGMAGKLGDDTARLIEVADKNSERLVRLINDLLDIEKLESGRLPIDRREVDVQEALEQAIADNSPYAAGYGVRLELADERTEARVRVDPDRFAQIMANLLSNAIKYSPRGGVVSVATRTVGRRIEIEIVDRGSGIPESFRERIFDRFAQADGSDVRQRGGTGLGLAITRSLVEHMDGEIGFDSRIGEGTRFFVRFPMHSRDTTPSGRDEREPSCILMVESDKEAAVELVHALEAAGHGVLLVDSIAQARSLLASTPVHALTLDPAMPDGDALAFLRELRATRDFRHLPVIMLGLNDPAEGTPHPSPNGGALGVVDWISVPAEPERLLQAVSSSVRHADAQADVLHVEDDADLHALLASLLARKNVRLHMATSLAEAREALSARHHDLVVLDLVLPDGDGADLLPELARCSPPTPVIIFSAVDITTSTAHSALRRLIKSRCDTRELARIIDQYLHQRPSPQERSNMENAS
jgi:PAS domain S-box-containing protein